MKLDKATLIAALPLIVGTDFIVVAVILGLQADKVERMVGLGALLLALPMLGAGAWQLMSVRRGRRAQD